LLAHFAHGVVASLQKLQPQADLVHELCSPATAEGQAAAEPLPLVRRPLPIHGGPKVSLVPVQEMLQRPPVGFDPS